MINTNCKEGKLVLAAVQSRSHKVSELVGRPAFIPTYYAIMEKDDGSKVAYIYVDNVWYGTNSPTVIDDIRTIETWVEFGTVPVTVKECTSKNGRTFLRMIAEC